jgi:transcriptional regulator with XRE-family HTH domain
MQLKPLNGNILIMNTARNIARLRQSKGWSQSEFARRVGVSAQSVQQWEDVNGTAPNRKNQEKAAKVLGVTRSQLMFGVAEQATSIPADLRPMEIELLKICSDMTDAVLASVVNYADYALSQQIQKTSKTHTDDKHQA